MLTILKSAPTIQTFPKPDFQRKYSACKIGQDKPYLPDVFRGGSSILRGANFFIIALRMVSDGGSRNRGLSISNGGRRSEGIAQYWGEGYARGR